MTAEIAKGPFHALSIDVEEYFQVSAFENVIEKGSWDAWESRVEVETHTLLDLFDEKDAKATFFTLGYIAEHFPNLVREIVARGHELGCHGYAHVRVTDQNPDSFAAELAHSKKLLEDVAGVPVIGYRAASFSINATNPWAFSVINDAGFTYSSSTYPVRHDHYGIADGERTPYRPQTAPDLVEIPVATARVLGHNFPAGGGGYFRLFPYFVSKTLINVIEKQHVRRANTYFHPWEFDPQQPRPDGVTFKARFRHYLNQSRALKRLGRLLDDFNWRSFAEVYADELGQRVT